MMFSSKPLSSALVAMVSLSIAVSASLDPIEQHLLARDSTPFQKTKEATGKLATPVNLGRTQTSPQAVLALTGEDLHTNAPPATTSPLEDSKITVPADDKGAAAVASLVGGEAGTKAHCFLGHKTAKIKRIRYQMRVQLDRDESGAATIAEASSVQGMVLKATSGLYTSKDPTAGSCAKTLARHGEACAHRPYIVPHSSMPQGYGKPSKTNTETSSLPKPDNGNVGAPASDAGGQPKPIDKEPYHAGPYMEKRADARPVGEWKKADTAADLIFKRDGGIDPASGTEQPATKPPGTEQPGTKPPGMVPPTHDNFAPAPGMGRGDGSATQQTESDSYSKTPGPSGGVCIDTVKRDKQVTKVVPTKAGRAPVGSADSSEPLHFELVRSDDREGVWNQIIYDAHGEPIDVTHLALSSSMSFWRAEYFCKECQPGKKKHTVLYEKIEIEMDEVEENDAPTVHCVGEAHATNFHKREKSRYQDKNNSGIEYTGAIFSIDRVALGMYDKNGNGGSITEVEGGALTETGHVSAGALAGAPAPDAGQSKMAASGTPEVPGVDKAEQNDNPDKSNGEKKANDTPKPADDDKTSTETDKKSSNEPETPAAAAKKSADGISKPVDDTQKAAPIAKRDFSEEDGPIF